VRLPVQSPFHVSEGDSKYISSPLGDKWSYGLGAKIPTSDILSPAANQGQICFMISTLLSLRVAPGVSDRRLSDITVGSRTGLTVRR